ncbi:MAG: sulfatase-like hydrolase/transferase [Pseudomonadota bacterium]
MFKNLSFMRTGAISALFRLLQHPLTMLAAMVPGFALVYQLENNLPSLPFAAAILLALFALLFTVSRRVAFSFYTTWLITVVISAISLVKYKTKGFSAHFYDVVFSGSDKAALRFLFSEYGAYIFPVLATAVLAVVVGTLFFRSEKPGHAGLRTGLAMVLVSAIALPLTYPKEASFHRYFYYLQGRHMTAAFVSLLDIEYLLRGNVLEHELAQVPPQAPFSAPKLAARQCAEKQPDIFVVLGESQVDPAIFPQLKSGAKVSALMGQANGSLKPMTVESFGGGTWVSTLSLMTGLPANAFGWRQPYLTVELEGKVREALPEVLARCGYRTVAQLPMEKSFVNEGHFLQSIGFEDVIDKGDLRAPHYHMRDDFYLDAAERFIEQHRREDGRPLFMYVQTMFAHSPYDHRAEPQIVLEGEPFDNDPAVAEYLRRMVIARQALGDFVAARKADAGPNGTLVADFGDHQSLVTKPLVDELAGQGALAEPGSIAYRTFYTLQGFGLPVGLSLRRDVSTKPLDLHFFGSRILAQAGLPLSPLWQDIARLDAICGGALLGCEADEALKINLRRRVDSGMLNILSAGAGS